MIFPFKSKWFWQNPLDPADHIDQKIDRVIADRSYRLAIGLSVSDCFETLRGCLVVARGHGKYLRLRQAIAANKKLPESLSVEFKRISRIENPSLLDTAAITADLAEIQAGLAEELKSHAGKYVDRLLLVACDDPGIWFTDIDGKPLYRPICDPVSLAEICGINVVDAFPVRDLMVGGNGQGIDALPTWLLMADRSETVAREAKLIFSIGQTSQATFLPASDGLDSELPNLKVASGPGISILKNVVAAVSGGSQLTSDDLVNLYVDGKTDEQILLQLQTISDQEKLASAVTAICSDSSLADLVRTTIVFIVDAISDAINNLGIKLGNGNVQIDCLPELAGIFVNQFQSRWANVGVRGLDFKGLKCGNLSAATTAFLGLACVDQLPVNVPWVTGASCQKILGRLSPGTPSNWRRLLCEMADFQPPAMRLRDAV